MLNFIFELLNMCFFNDIVMFCFFYVFSFFKKLFFFDIVLS